MLERAVTLGLIAGESAERKPSAVETEVIRLFDELRAPLLRYLLSTGLGAHDGEEVVQDTFLALFEHLRRGRPRNNLRGWIFQVGHNLALKQRRRKTAVAVDDIDARAEHPDPEQEARANQRRRQLVAVVGALPERDRACLTLRAEGLRYREIAEVLGMSLGAVAGSLARSLDRIGRADEKWR